MKEKNVYHVLKFRKKPFYVWLLRLVWVVWLVIWAEIALGSKAELEPRAFIISLVIFLLSLLAGLLLWLVGLRKVRIQKK